MFSHFFYYFVQTVGVDEAILSDPARCKPWHCWGGHSSSWLLGFFLLPTPALMCKAPEVGGKSWLLPRSANWRRLELCFQGKEFLEVIFKEFCKGGASLTHSGLRSTPIFSGFLMKTNQTMEGGSISSICLRMSCSPSKKLQPHSFFL